MNGERLIVVVGPSGAGKDSVLAAWRARHPPRVHFARRVVTRAAAGEDHEGIDPAAFDGLLAHDALAVHWRAHGLQYGLRRSELAPLAQGLWVVANGSREHLPRWRAMQPALRVVEISAPPALLHHRLTSRGREAGSEARARLARQAPPVAADLHIVNDGPLDAAVARLDGWWRGLATESATIRP